MRKRSPLRNQSTFSDAQTVGLAALASYADVLAFLSKSGVGRCRRPTPVELPFVHGVKGIENLFHSMSAAAPATPDTDDEEWNPLSQRPHTPLPPPVKDELGAEVTALKEAVDAFTTLTHEMMHVALWEPFFTGFWRPRGKGAFREFSLLAEGFCFFFSDIVVSSAVRARLPDGEFALERRTPSNALFHPARAFRALGIEDHAAILDIYLEGFNGGQTALWQPRGGNTFVAKLAAQAYDFYAGSLRYLDEAHAALTAFGGLSDFYRRFCAIPGLPSLLDEAQARRAGGEGRKAYFAEFFRSGLPRLAALKSSEVTRVRWRRMLQMRAYYALQVRWLLHEDLVVARAWTAPLRRRLAQHVDTYLDGLHDLLVRLARRADPLPERDLARLDAAYDEQVRTPCQAHDAWVGHRWLIAPRRAGGLVNVFTASPAKGRAAKVHLLQTVSFLSHELTQRLSDGKTVEARAEILTQLQRVAALGAVGGRGSATDTSTAARRLRSELARPQMLPIWSVPLASFDPAGNRYRELAFSYQ
jgi:hypothetical protein